MVRMIKILIYRKKFKKCSKLAPSPLHTFVKRKQLTGREGKQPTREEEQFQHFTERLEGNLKNVLQRQEVDTRMHTQISQHSES